MDEIGRIRGGGAEAREVMKEQWNKGRGAKLAGLVEDVQTGFKKEERMTWRTSRRVGGNPRRKNASLFKPKTQMPKPESRNTEFANSLQLVHNRKY